jgi:hypothetical protein
MLVGSKVDYDISNLYIPKDGKGDIDYQKSFNATLTIIVRDKEGNVIKRYKQKSHSPTANFIGLMLPVSYYNGIQQCIKLTTTSNTTINYGYNCAWITYPNGGENNPDYMQNIIVGSGTQSNTYNAYNLNAPISNGSGAGQLIYSSISVPTSITINGNQAYFIISQSYTNQSGGTINISEVGIVVNLYVGRPGNANNQAGSVLVWYDTLSSPISVGSGQQVIIYYTFSVNA